MSTKKMTTVGVLCAMALALNLVIRFPMIPTVSFLNYDPKDVVIVIGGLMYGPMTSLIMSAVCSGLEIFYRGGTQRLGSTSITGRKTARYSDWLPV